MSSYRPITPDELASLCASQVDIYLWRYRHGWPIPRSQQLGSAWGYLREAHEVDMDKYICCYRFGGSSLCQCMHAKKIMGSPIVTDGWLAKEE